MPPIPETLEREVAETRAKIKELRASGTQKREQAEKLVEDVKAAGHNPVAGTSDEDRDAFERIDAAYKEADRDLELASELEDRLHRLLDHAADAAAAASKGDLEHPAARRYASMADKVLQSSQYAKLRESGVLDMAGPSETPQVTMGGVEILDRDQTIAAWKASARPVFFADAGDGSPLVPDDQRLIPPVPIPVRQVTVLDLITVGRTDTDLVRWTRQTLRDNNAGPVPYGTASSKSRYTYEQVSSDVRRIAHHVVADKGNLADQGQFRTILESEGIEDLRLTVEEQVVAGSGQGQNLEGLYEAQGINDQPRGGDSRADAAHKAMTVVRVALEREPTAWGMHPIDFQGYWLEKGQDGHYLHHRGPQEVSVKSVWGLPAVVSTVFTEGVPMVADFRRAYTLWQRMGVVVEASDNVDDFFLEGLVAIQFTTRAAGATKQPKAVCTVSDFDTGGSS